MHLNDVIHAEIQNILILDLYIKMIGVYCVRHRKLTVISTIIRLLKILLAPVNSIKPIIMPILLKLFLCHTILAKASLMSIYNTCIFNYKHPEPFKRICVFEHSVMTNFNCACPAIQMGQGSGFLSEGSS